MQTKIIKWDTHALDWSSKAGVLQLGSIKGYFSFSALVDGTTMLARNCASPSFANIIKKDQEDENEEPGRMEQLLKSFAAPEDILTVEGCVTLQEGVSHQLMSVLVVGSLKSSILSSTSFQLDKTFWQVGRTGVE